jgi:hypothetical protein
MSDRQDPLFFLVEVFEQVVRLWASLAASGIREKIDIMLCESVSLLFHTLQTLIA